MDQPARFTPRWSYALAALLVTSTLCAQTAPIPSDPKNDGVLKAPSEETPIRQPTTATDVNGKSIPTTPQKLVLADPDSKMYMPCRDANESKSTTDDSTPIKLNPKAAVLSEEAAKQHGFKASAHKVDCPKQ